MWSQEESENVTSYSTPLLVLFFHVSIDISPFLLFVTPRPGAAVARTRDPSRAALHALNV